MEYSNLIYNILFCMVDVLGFESMTIVHKLPVLMLL